MVAICQLQILQICGEQRILGLWVNAGEDFESNCYPRRKGGRHLLQSYPEDKCWAGEYGFLNEILSIFNDHKSTHLFNIAEHCGGVQRKMQRR